MKYLGVPLKPTKWNRHDCESVVDKIRKLTMCWGTRHLSFACHTQLVSSVLFRIRAYWMNIFCLPQSIIKEIYGLCRRFLWGARKEGRKKIHAVSQDKICLPKANGGFGFKEGSKWNKAGLGKYLWAINFKQDSLWLKSIHCIYIKSKFFWTDLKVGDNSWYWRKLLKLCSTLSPTLLRDCTAGGKYSLTKCYNLLVGTVNICPIYKQVWCSLAVPKHRFIFQLATQQRLLTKDSLASWFNGFDVYYLVCLYEEECHNHLFFKCHFSQALLSRIR